MIQGADALASLCGVSYSVGSIISIVVEAPRGEKREREKVSRGGRKNNKNKINKDVSHS